MIFRRRRNPNSIETTAGSDPEGLSLLVDRAEDLGEVRDLELAKEPCLISCPPLAA